MDAESDGAGDGTDDASGGSGTGAGTGSGSGDGGESGSTGGTSATSSDGGSSDGTSGSGDTSSTGGDGDGDGDGDAQSLCTGSGGTWDPTSCGHWTCGEAPLCDAVIPGCNCGLGSNFIEGVGCQADSTCGATDEALCTSTGGTWDESSCGDYVCGFKPDCEAIIPGCDCGEDSNFATGTGCQADSTCPDRLGAGDVCDPNDSLCGTGLSCCYPCGVMGCDFQCTAQDPGTGGCPPPPP